MAFNSRGRLALVSLLLALAVFVPGLASATDARQMSPTADAWVSAARPQRNFGRTTVLGAQAGAYESYLRFKLTPWIGQPADGLDLVLGGVGGDASTLSVARVATGWRELGLTWLNRPAQVGTISVPAMVGADGVHFPLGALFDSGTIERNTISLRVTSLAATFVRFSSREGAQPPTLFLREAPVRSEQIAISADTYATPVKPDGNFGALQWLAVDGRPRAEAFLSFDVSGWFGHRLARTELAILLRDFAGPGISVYRVDDAWDERGLTWNSRPPTGIVVGGLDTATRSGATTIDISAVYSNGVVDSPRLALRLATTNVRYRVVAAGVTDAHGNADTPAAAVPLPRPGLGPRRGHVAVRRPLPSQRRPDIRADPVPLLHRYDARHDRRDAQRPGSVERGSRAHHDTPGAHHRPRRRLVERRFR